MEPPYTTFLFDSLFTEAGTAIGIVGEVAFGIWDSRIQTELRRRSNEKLAETIARAAEAELQTERLRKELAWRHISTEQATKISNFFATGEIVHRARAFRFSGRVAVQVIEFMGDPEIAGFAYEIAQIFRKNAWHVERVQIHSASVFSGLMVAPFPDNAAQRAVRGVFEEAGITLVDVVRTPQGAMTTFEGTIPEDVMAAHIYVGSKPKSDLA